MKTKRIPGRRFGCILLSLLLILTLVMPLGGLIVPAPVAEAATIVASGTCDYNLTWTLDSDGVFTISGSGEMKKYDWPRTLYPWSGVSDQIKHIIVKDGVQNVAEHAFRRLSNLESFVAEGNLTSVGGTAVCQCPKLSYVRFNTVGIMYDWIFSEDTRIHSITVMGDLEQMGGNIFAGYRLSTIYGRAGTNIESWANSNGIEFIVLPNDGPTGLTANCGQRLGDVTLPSDWAWDDPDAYVGSAGETNTFTANYVPAGAPYDVTVTVSGTAHTPGDPAWSWTSDYRSATLSVTCRGCGTVLRNATDNNPSMTEVSAADCTHDRVIKYTASVVLDGVSYTDETENVTLPGTATGIHAYGQPVWTWTRDHSAATAAFTCSACGDTHTETDNAPVNVNGSLTATVVFKGVSYSDVATYQVGDLIRYGTYPQAQVTDPSLIAALNDVEKNWASYRYYSGTSTDEYTRSFNGQMKPGDWMRFADFSYNGEKYRAVILDEYRPGRTGHSFARGGTTTEQNGFSKHTVYYFKYEPLTWRVLDPAEGLVICEKMIDAQPYQNMIYNQYAADYGINDNGDYYQGTNSSVYCSDYVTSHVRAWLNDDFYNTAFSAQQKENIQLTTLNNKAYTAKYNSAATTDKVFLISYDDARNSAYGFTSNADRRLSSTDYALSQGYMRSTYTWWLRSPGSKSYYACSVRDSGDVTNNGTVCDAFYGMVPACRLTLLAENTTLSDTLYSDEKRADQVCNVTLAPGEAAGESVTQEVFRDYTLPAVEGLFTAPAGKLFSGWLSSADGTVYKAGESLTLSGDVIFTAQWADPVHASFEPGEAEGETIINGDVLPGTRFNLPSNPFSAPRDTIFSGWSDGTNVYQPGYSYTLNETTTFVAQWTDAVYAYLEPGEAEGETRTHARVLPGTQITLPANPYTAPENMLFNGWSDGTNVYQPGYRYTLNENVTFTAQWVQGVNVTFDSLGGSAVASQLIYPNTAASRPATPTKAGCQFKGWRLDDGFYDFSTPLTEDVTLYAVWVEGAGSEEHFDDNGASFPAGWNAENNWQIKESAHATSGTVTPHSGRYFAYHPYYNSSRLTMPVTDLSGQAAVTLSFWYQNQYFYGYEDHLVVAYRVNGGDWVELFRTTEEHQSWTEASVTLPAAALTPNVEISFYADVDNGYGVFLDDVVLAASSGHVLTFDAEGNVLTATCSNDICAWDTHTLSLTLNAPEKAVYGDGNSEKATLFDLGRFNMELELSVSEDDIEYYKDGTLLPAAPVNAGDYRASLTVTLDGTDYTIYKDYTIAKATPAYDLPDELSTPWGSRLSDVALPDGWAWDAPDTLLNEEGSFTFAATFTPADADNYVNVTDEFTVTVYVIYTPVAAKNETCTEDGNIAYYAGNDGKYYVSADGETFTEIAYEDTVLPRLGHDYAFAGFVWAADGASATAKYVCSRCGDDVYHAAEMTDEFFDFTCYDDAYTVYTATYDGHVETNTVVQTGTAHHIWDEGTYTKRPTCLEDGSMRFVCAVCGAVRNDVIGALGHDVVVDPAIDPTCTERGVTEGTHCRRCAAVLVAQIVLPALGHNWSDWTETREPTCAEPGLEERTCARCGEVDVREIESPAHEWSEWEVTAEPGCETLREKTRTCAVCGSVETKPAAATGHDWVKSETSTATCTEDGVWTYTCSKCGDTYEEPAAALGHDWAEGEGGTATCTAAGTVVYACSRCGETREEESSALGHVWGEWEVVREATRDENGLAKRVCARCGETEERETLYPVAKSRNVSFVSAKDITVTVHLGATDVNVTHQGSKTVSWYPDMPLRFHVTVGSGFTGVGYTVVVNGQELAPDADGGYTLPAGSSSARVVVVAEEAAGPETDDGTCPLCGKTHNGSIWDRVVGFFHGLIWFFTHLFVR